MKARRVLRESNETLKEGYGFANQGEDCSKFEDEHRIEVVKEHRLVETSSSWNREKFRSIIDEAIQERDQIPAIVFPRVDRFARNLEAAGYYLGLLRQNGLTVMFAQEDLVVNNEASVMTVLMFFIHSFKADQDGKQIKHNALSGRDRLATDACEIPNGMVMWPFDYMSKRTYGKMATGKPSVNEQRADWIRRWAQEWILEEGLGVAQICRRLDNAKIPPPSETKGRKNPAAMWSPKAIRDILRSRQIIGEFWWKGKLYLKDERLRILSDEVFEAVQNRLDENRERSYYNAAKYDYPPFRKMVFCGHHPNQIMYGKPVGSTTWYYCPRCKSERSGNCVRCEVIWKQYQQEIKASLLQEQRLIPALRKQFGNKDFINHLEWEIQGKDDEVKKWEDAQDAAFRLGMSIRNYPQERVQEQIDKAEQHMQRLKIERIDLEKRLMILKQQGLNEEGIRRLCQIVAKSIDQLTKNQWEMLNKLLRLRLTVFSRELVTVNVALPPLTDMEDSEIEFSRL